MKGVTLAYSILVSMSLGCLEQTGFETSMRRDAEPTVDRALPDTQMRVQSCERVFVYRHPGDRVPSRVQLAGDFEVDPWSANIEMDGPNEAGEYVSRLRLPEGNYRYKFVVDGVWILDPENPEATIDGSGNENSAVLHICPFQSECVRNSECDDASVCRNFLCVACDCGDGLFCDPQTKQCVDTIPCQSASDCLPGQVCRGAQCAQCIQDSECDTGTRCLTHGCGEPACLTDSACTVDTQRCERYACEPKPCASQNFFLADPNGDFQQVRLAGSFTEWAEQALTLERLDDSRWWLSVPLINGAYPYKFIVTRRDGNSEWITDPLESSTASDGLGGQNSLRSVVCEGGSSTQCGAPDAYDWRDAVMYFAMIDRFYDSDDMRTLVEGATDGDATTGPSGQFQGGDLIGLTQKLGYLESLGVTALWLSAPYKNRNYRGDSMNRCLGDNQPEGCDPNFYSAYHGYWPSPDNVDYSTPDNPIPTPSVEGRLGTAQDLHTLVESAHEQGMKILFDYVMNHIDVASPLFEAHPDWFATRDDGSFFRCGDVADGQQGWNHPYWSTRCVFTDYLPAFEFDNLNARAWSIADAVWWAKTFNIDGYRLDAIKHVPQTWLTDLRAALTTAFPEPDGGRFYLVGETFDYFDKALLKAFVDVETKLDGQFDFPLKKRLCEGVFRGDMNTLQRFMDEENRGYYGVEALMTTWIGNHDIPRAIHYASGEIQNCTEGSTQWNGWDWRPAQPQDPVAYERLGLAFGVMFTTEGIPLIYYGDEIGLAGGGDPDNRRLMPWDESQLLPAQMRLRTHLQRLAQIRQAHKSLSRGTRQTLRVDANSWVYKTSCQDERFEDLTVVINRGDAPIIDVAVPTGAYVDLLSNAMFSNAVRVEPRSMLILRQVRE